MPRLSRAISSDVRKCRGLLYILGGLLLLLGGLWLTPGGFLITPGGSWRLAVNS